MESANIIQKLVQLQFKELQKQIVNGEEQTRIMGNRNGRVNKHEK